MITDQDLRQAISEAKYGVNRSEALTKIFEEVHRARRSEAQAMNLLGRLEKFHGLGGDAAEVKTFLDAYYGKDL